MPAAVDVAFQALFDHARARVSEADIRAHAPNDPGYGGYVQVWSAIVRQDRLPRSRAFAVTEPIDLSSWSTAQEEPDASFRRYRVLLKSVALCWHAEGSPLDGPNEALALLLDDAAMLADPELFARLVPAVLATHAGLRAAQHVELAFVSLALVILQAMDPRAGLDVGALALRVVEEELAVVSRGDGRGPAFVWGLTCFTGKQAVWRRLVERYVVGEDAAVAELRARLLAEG